MTRSLTLLKSGPVDHIAAAVEHYAQAEAHAADADREGREALQNGAEHYARLAQLKALNPGVREHYRQVSDAMNAAVQGIAAISSKGGM